MSTGERWRLGHRPALDGLRGIAIALVLVGHVWFHAFDVTPPEFAEAGVAVFFALSGFLITSLLLEERDRSARISLRRFYERRARRLLPALAACLACVAALTAAFSYRRLASPWDFVGAVFYWQNWRVAAIDPLTHPGGLNHTWSLSIEEQFYLLWPLALIAAARFGRRGVVALTCVGIAASLVVKLWLWDGGAGEQRVYFGTDTRMDNLLLGCLLALVLSSRPVSRTRPTAGLAVLVVAVAVGVSTSPLWLPTVVAVGTVLALALLAQPGRPGVLGWTPLRYLGSRSYALYLWHLPLLYMFGVAPWWISGTVPVALAFGAAELSWRHVERPFLVRKDAKLSVGLKESRALREADDAGARST